MYGGLTMMDRVELDYVKARRRARFGWLRGLFGRGSGDLRDFESVRKSLGNYGTRRIGTREIEVDRIVGSVGRHREFDEDFMPTNGRLRQRWMRMAQFFWSEGDFQPIRVYKVKGEYYVEDGNHRVSVAKFHGVAMLDAEVTEVVTSAFVNLRCAPVEKRGKKIV